MTHPAVDAPRSASRVDARTGIRETVEFFEGEAGYLYGCTYTPVGDPSAGVVVCSPLLAELQTSYRREVLIARSLAERGFAVQRFHYRGAGNSDGSPEQQTFDSLRADTLAATERLRTTAKVTRLGFVGTRLGGHVAASVASPGSPLVIISPVLDTEAYFREVLRGYLFGLVKEGNSAVRSTRDALGELRVRGSLDVLGYPVTWTLYESFVGRSLEVQLPPTDRPVLLLPVGKAGHAIDGREASHASLEVRAITGQDVWWFGGGAHLREGEASATDEILRVIEEWIGRVFAGEAA